MKLALALTAGTAAAFVAPSSAPAAKTQLAAAPVQEWAGATAPFGFFDPLGLAPETQEEFMLYREAELTHGRGESAGLERRTRPLRPRLASCLPSPLARP